jgi:phosphatidylserine/phosphatidylglycerophosphate/cardiolipin synthase-like enzyme
VKKSKTKNQSLIAKLILKVAIPLALTLLAVFYQEATPTPSVESQVSLGGKTQLFANQNHDDLSKLYTSAIKGANESIFFVIYSLTDDSIISALKSKANQGIDVRLVCDAKASPYIDTKVGDKVQVLRRFGAGLMHQKILVIDGKKTLLGSANMTYESLQMHGNLVTQIEDPLFATAALQKAKSMKIEGLSEPFPLKIFELGENHQMIELWYLPDNKDAVGRLRSLIRSAEKTLFVAMFTWTRTDLAHEVIAAHKRGVKTTVVIDHNSGKGASASIVNLFKKSGVAIALSPPGPLLHHKFAYIDRKTLVNGSANWTKAAFSTNDDCFIVLHPLSERQISQMDTLCNTLWKTAL